MIDRVVGTIAGTIGGALIAGVSMHLNSERVARHQRALEAEKRTLQKLEEISAVTSDIDLQASRILHELASQLRERRPFELS